MGDVMAIKMTRAEFCDKYGDVEVVFRSYYKFTFTHGTTLPDGKLLTVGYGGDSDEIYSHEVEAELKQKVKEVCPYMGAVYEGGEEIEGFYDF